MRRLLLVTTVLCAVALAPPAVEPAAADAKPDAAAKKGKQTKKGKRAKKKPRVWLVAPMRAKVGRRVVIRGGRFSRSRRRNTIIFRAPDRRVAFAKPRRAFPRKLVVRVPGSVERLLRKADGDASKGLPTRLRLRVITRRRFGRLTIRRRSPLVVSGLRAGPIPPCGVGSDFDNDYLPNELEARLNTDPCRADTDGDQVEDGFEHQSALDLNRRALPYPGKRPFANPLDPTDAGNDYDGDGLSLLEEFRAWAKPAASPAPSLLQGYTSDPGAPPFGGPFGGGPAFGNHAWPMNYSDGKQASVAGQPTDDERDADGDGLSNFDEIRGLMRVGRYPEGTEGECAYGYDPVLPRPFLEPDYLDWDSDGDGVWDGNDDQDNDGVSNVDEIEGPYQSCSNAGPLPVNGARDGRPALRHPYNPCLPYTSDTCRRHPSSG